jgi:hypothetical protein
VQKKINRRILQTGEYVDSKNSGGADFLGGMNPLSMTVAMVAIDNPSPGFQCVGGVVLRNENQKWLTTTRMRKSPDPEVQRDVTILATVHDALAWNRSHGRLRRLGLVRGL